MRGTPRAPMMSALRSRRRKSTSLLAMPHLWSRWLRKRNMTLKITTIRSVMKKPKLCSAIKGLKSRGLELPSANPLMARLTMLPSRITSVRTCSSSKGNFKSSWQTVVATTGHSSKSSPVRILVNFSTCRLSSSNPTRCCKAQSRCNCNQCKDASCRKCPWQAASPFSLPTTCPTALTASQCLQMSSSACPRTCPPLI